MSDISLPFQAWKNFASALVTKNYALVTKKKGMHIIIIIMSKACKKQLHKRSGYKVGGKGADHVLDLRRPHMTDLLT